MRLQEPVNKPAPKEASTFGVAGRLGFRRWTEDGVESDSRAFPEEVPIAMVVNDDNYAVMLGSPADLTDFAYGFLHTEGVIRDVAEVDSVDTFVRPEGQVVQVRLLGAMPAQMRRERRIAGVSSCGLCGVESLREAVRPIARVPDGPVLDGVAITRAMAQLGDNQPYNAVTGAMHVAAFAEAGGDLLRAREDVGRHNALDKLIGALMRDGITPESGFMVTSSRCSYELVQKAAAFGVRLLCTISAPTALAVRLARQANISLVSLVRGDSFIVLAGSERIEGTEALTDG
ncbi:formate dehydrogenase accessory sulfurtransferase FdhD [Thiohalorhabdus methylotrophus]|uniref:Sulfur carrier protein FdhD n=1 Tax=Thiohalorhabdus methylotrophus TaxID=3242694 RepID=A0ABV4TWX7_9GAMM